jgi:hypothetical protein
MVGFRVFDVGLLILWLVWFFRLRDDEDDQPDDGPGGGGSGPKRGGGPKGGGGLRRRLPQGDRRVRDHLMPRPMLRPRGSEPLPRTLPARVRRPYTPEPAPRRA